MHRCTTALLRRLAQALLALALFTSAVAASLAVYPFSSEDPLLGIAMADELAAAFHDDAVVFGPDVATGLVPPLIVVDGFINVGRVLGGDIWTSPTGAELLRTGAGVDVAVSGTVEQYDGRTVLRLEVAHATGTRSVELSAEPGDRGRLVRQAARFVAQSLGVSQAPGIPQLPALAGDYETYVRTVWFAASGLVTDAAANAPQLEDGSWPERGFELLEDARAVADGSLTLADADMTAEQAGRRNGRRAVYALSLPALHETDAADSFARLVDLGVAALGHAWLGILATDDMRYDEAATQFELARQHAYPYAAALLASFQLAQGEVGAAEALVDELVAGGADSGAAGLVGASIVATVVEDIPREKGALQALGRAAPFLAYPYERLSFIAFDEDDALTAAQALAVAVELEPSSSLYWTNLGWARYLLGFLEQSEQASRRAIDLDGNQHIAAYNLGLVQAVTGRLSSALEAYDYAVELDPGVNDEVIVDLVNARALYPGVSAVEYALARLYEAKGQRLEARAAYQRFVRFAEAEGRTQEYLSFVQVAEQRLVALNAPLPPLEIFGSVSVRLGQRGPVAEPFHPGDPLYPSFELSTPGDQLPARVNVTLSLLRTDAAEAAEPVASTTATVDTPPGAVGFVVDYLYLELPADLAAGSYRLVVDASSGSELADQAETTFSVAGTPEPIRQLLGRNVVMTGLEIESPLYGRADIGSEARVIDRMVEELRSTAAAAEAALPAIQGGRFDGMTGSQLFLNASGQDVVDFLAYVADSGARDSRFTFVDGFAQWALDGTP